MYPIRAVLLGVALGWAWMALPAATRPAGVSPRFDHAPYGKVLRQVVRDARVDYARLKAAPGELDAYLERIATVPEAEFAEWPRADRLALLINLYNARTLRLIAENYPVGSIRDIGLIPGAAWKRKIVRFGGRVFSLDDLEHGILRKEYDEPRVHFALVCAARGCPPLRDEPYTAARLEEQLEDQGRRFLADPARNRLEIATRTLWVSPIFDWFAEDFRRGGRSVAAFVSRYLGEADRRRLEEWGEPKVRFTEYDWTLNDVPRP